ncbi:MAG: hypothetical protein U0841_13880 [Chloroflexia bacterium]
MGLLLGELLPQLHDGAVDDLADVGLGEAEDGGDFPVGESGGELEAEDFALAFRQPREVGGETLPFFAAQGLQFG